MQVKTQSVAPAPASQEPVAPPAQKPMPSPRKNGSFGRWRPQALRELMFIAYGSRNFTKPAYIRNSQTWKPATEDQVVPLSGKVCVVTGANQGIGKAAAVALAKRGATVHLVCRNKERGEEAAKEIREATGNEKVIVEVCDLSSLSDIKALSQRLQSTPSSAVDVLVNNAGIMEQKQLKSVDGFEMNFAVNVLGTYVLTESLLPALRKAGPEAKVITVATGGILSEPLNRDLQSEKKFDGTSAYARNKRVQLVVNEKWAQLHGKDGIGFYTMHPGWVDTTTLKNSMPGFYNMFKTSLRTPEQGADTIDWLASSKNAALKGGAFYFDRAVAEQHLSLGGTKYTEAEATAVYEDIVKLAASKA